jgi:hypothetical protein
MVVGGIAVPVVAVRPVEGVEVDLVDPSRMDQVR